MSGEYVVLMFYHDFFEKSHAVDTKKKLRKRPINNVS